MLSLGKIEERFPERVRKLLPGAPPASAMIADSLMGVLLTFERLPGREKHKKQKPRLFFIDVAYMPHNVSYNDISCHEGFEATPKSFLLFYLFGTCYTISTLSGITL